MRAASHGVCFERAGEPGCLWFSFGFAVCVSFGLLIGGLFGIQMASCWSEGR